MATPLLLLSDGVTSGTGLGRITRDLAVRIREHLGDVFEVGTAGYGGPQKRSLGFPQYAIDMKDWVVLNLPDIWNDFAVDRKGIVMTVWDASRMLWFSRPENCGDVLLKNLLTNAPFKRWGYFPMDATGPNDRLTAILGHIIDGYDRALAYSGWAEAILRRSLQNKAVLDSLSSLPHGIETDVFKPRNRIVARHGFGERLQLKNNKGKWIAIPDDRFMIGIVATNQMRKDYGLAIQALAEVKKSRKLLVWIHIDQLEKHWSIPGLLNDYGFVYEDAIVTALPMTDEQMSWCYSACDLTLGIGNAEGFGYPIFESLACGTPCLHGHDGGAPEHMPEEMLIEPIATRFDSPYSCRRNVYNPSDWAKRILELPKKNGESLLPTHLDWNNNWPRWEAWFRKGVSDENSCGDVPLDWRSRSGCPKLDRDNGNAVADSRE